MCAEDLLAAVRCGSTGPAHPCGQLVVVLTNQRACPCPASPVAIGSSDAIVSTFIQVRGLVFEAKNSLGALAETVGAACRRLTDANVPHNLFIVDRGARIFLLPNAFAERKVRIWA